MSTLSNLKPEMFSQAQTAQAINAIQKTEREKILASYRAGAYSQRYANRLLARLG